MTIDALVCAIVEHLLRQHVLRWPGDHTTLQVLDDWRGHGWLKSGSFQRVATINSSGLVTSTTRRVANPRPGISTRELFHRHLDAGRCTHEEIRDVLTIAMAAPACRQAIITFLSSSVTDLVVDEVFDANNLDLDLVDLVCDANISVTLVGDPWQALYRFRGATPELVPRLLHTRGFELLPLFHSFRFQTPKMRNLGASLRDGRPVSLVFGDEYDVLLSLQWDNLWQAPSNVLPLSFGRVANKTDAATIVLLDHLVYSTFNRHAIFLPEALVLLGLDLDKYRSDGTTVLARVIETLGAADSDAPVKALEALRDAMKQLGAPRRPPAGTERNDQRQVERLAALAARLHSDARLVPVMTIHQAKGREWDRVGVRLSASDAGRLATGLDQRQERDRALYVALTRARYDVLLVA